MVVRNAILESTWIKKRYLFVSIEFINTWGVLQWWEYLTMATAESKTRHLLSFNHSSKKFILIPKYGCFFSMKFHSIVLYITWRMHEISHAYLIKWENAAKSVLMRRTWNIYNHTFSKSFCFIKFPSCGTLYHMGGTRILLQSPRSIIKLSKTHLSYTWNIDSYTFLETWVISFPSNFCPMEY